MLDKSKNEARLELTMDLFFISSNNCKTCDKVREWLHDMQSCKAFHIHEIDSESNEAISLAIAKGIDDLPGVAIGEHKVCGEDIHYDDVEAAIDAALKGM